jgi:hypothetical protein
VVVDLRLAAHRVSLTTNCSVVHSAPYDTGRAATEVSINDASRGVQLPTQDLTHSRQGVLVKQG